MNHRGRTAILGVPTEGAAFVPLRSVIVDDVMVEWAARAANLSAGQLRGLAFEDDWDEITEQERGGWRLVARAALGAALNA